MTTQEFDYSNNGFEIGRTEDGKNHYYSHEVTRLISADGEVIDLPKNGDILTVLQGISRLCISQAINLTTDGQLPEVRVTLGVTPEGNMTHVGPGNFFGGATIIEEGARIGRNNKFVSHFYPDEYSEESIAAFEADVKEITHQVTSVTLDVVDWVHDPYMNSDNHVMYIGKNAQVGDANDFEERSIIASNATVGSRNHVDERSVFWENSVVGNGNMFHSGISVGKDANIGDNNVFWRTVDVVSDGARIGSRGYHESECVKTDRDHD